MSDFVSQEAQALVVAHRARTDAHVYARTHARIPKICTMQICARPLHECVSKERRMREGIMYSK